MIYDNQFDASDDQTKKKRTGLPGEIGADDQYGAGLQAQPLGAPSIAPPPSPLTNPIPDQQTPIAAVGAYASPAPVPPAPPGAPTAGQTTPAPYTPTGGDATTGQGMAPAPTSAPATPVQASASAPTDPTGHNRAYLGADAAGAPVWGDDGPSDQSVRYDAQGNPQWNAGLTGYNQQDYDQRAKIAKMSPAERKAYADALEKQYSGRTTQTSPNSSSTLAIDAMRAADPAAARAYEYAQGLGTIQQHDPDAMRAMTSDNAIYGKPLQESDDPAYWARHHLGDPNWKAPMATNAPGDGSYRTIQGGQTFNDPAKGQAAFEAIQRQMKAGGSALFPNAQPGGTINADARAQLDAAANGTGSITNAPVPASSEGSGRGGTAPGRPIAVGEPGGTGGATGNTGGTSTSTQTPYGPGNDLLATQITPNVSDRQASANTLVDSAANAVGKGKSRGEIAQGYLDAFDTRSAPKLRDQIRAVGQRASSLGRVGMGDTEVEALNPYTDYLKERDALQFDLASTSASGDIGDRLNNLSALEGYQGQTYGQGVNDRGELRGERDFQNKMSRQAIEDAINQWQLQRQARNDEFSQGQTLGTFGYGNSPSNLLFGAGQQYGQSAGMDWNAFAQLLGPYLNKK